MGRGSERRAGNPLQDSMRNLEGWKFKHGWYDGTVGELTIKSRMMRNPRSGLKIHSRSVQGSKRTVDNPLEDFERELDKG